MLASPGQLYIRIGKGTVSHHEFSDVEARRITLNVGKKKKALLKTSAAAGISNPEWNEEYVVVVPKSTSNLTLTLWEKRASKSKEKATGSVFLNWHDLSPWRADSRVVTIGKSLTIELTLEFGPMQVMSSTPMCTKVPELRFCFERVHFWPGEVVRGVLTLNVQDPRSIYGLQISFDGMNYVDWFDELTEGSFTGHDVYFSKKHMLLGSLPPPSKDLSRKASKSGQSLVFMKEEFHQIGLKGEKCEEMRLEKGRLNFPFEFSLPLNIPHSISHMDGCVGIFYFVTARIFETGGRRNTMEREEIQIAPPRTRVLTDPTVSYTTEAETKLISKHAPVGDNFSHSLPDEVTLESISALSEGSSFWSQSASSLDRFSFLEESHLKSVSPNTDVDLDGDDAKWLTRKNSDVWAIKLDRVDGSRSPRRKKGLKLQSGTQSKSKEEKDEMEEMEAHAQRAQPTPWIMTSANDRNLGLGLELDGDVFHGESSEDEILSPRSVGSDTTDHGGMNEGRARSNSKQIVRPLPVAVNAILPPLAIIGKQFVFQVTIENRSNKPINSLRASFRSALYLNGYPGGRQYKTLREYWSPVGTVTKCVVNGKSRKDFPVQPGTSWRGDVSIQIPHNLYPSIQVRHLSLTYEIKLEARSSSKIMVGSFSWKQAIQVVQAHADKEVQLITPPTKTQGDPCHLLIGKDVTDISTAIVPLPISPSGQIPITGYHLPATAFQ